MIIIEYTLGICQPKESSRNNHPDWIIAVHSNPLESEENHLSLTISGLVSVFSPKHSLVHSQ
jgi:alpha-galactosidase